MRRRRSGRDSEAPWPPSLVPDRPVRLELADRLVQEFEQRGRDAQGDRLAVVDAQLQAGHAVVGDEGAERDETPQDQEVSCAGVYHDGSGASA